MAPIAAIAGIAQYTIVNQNHDYSYPFDPLQWDVRFIHSQDKTVGLDACWKSLRALLDTVAATDGDGIHVLAFHKSDQTRPKYETAIAPFYRLRFLDRTKLNEYGTEAFTRYLDGVLAEESLWRAKVCPDKRSHPLLLPENCFVAPDSLSDAWESARQAKSRRDIEAVAQMVVGLSRLHKDPNAYHDMKAFRFKYLGQHGEPPIADHNWKIGFHLPPRMHYDVNRVDDEEPFDWTGSGTKRRYPTHANVTPHGIVL